MTLNAVPSALPTSHRLTGLDSLRGGAAAVVVLYHYTSNYQRLFGHRSNPIASLPYGALGVQLFFIISGFVILMTLERTARSADFVRSRFARLFPTYWSAVALTFVVLRLIPLPGRPPSFGRAVLNLSMVQDLYHVTNIDGVYWTLRIELSFYVVMLAVYAAGWLRRVDVVLLALVAANVTAARLAPHSIAAAEVRSVLALDYLPAFLIGVCLFQACRGWNLRAGAVLGLCLLTTFVTAPAVDAWLTVAFAAAVYAAGRGWLEGRKGGPVLFLGSISYPLYLTHQRIGYALIYQMERHSVPTNIAIPVAILVALSVATGLSRWVERPALRLLRGRRPGTVPAPLQMP